MILNTASIRELRSITQDVLGRLADGPVMIMNRSDPQGVIVSVKMWNEMQEELQRLRLAAAQGTERK